MEDISRSIRRDATDGISHTDLTLALAVLERMKSNLQALDNAPAEDAAAV
jgi:hypothetical protein